LDADGRRARAALVALSPGRATVTLDCGASALVVPVCVHGAPVSPALRSVLRCCRAQPAGHSRADPFAHLDGDDVDDSAEGGQASERRRKAAIAAELPDLSPGALLRHSLFAPLGPDELEQVMVTFDRFFLSS